MKYKDTLNAKGAVNELLPEGKTLEEIQAEQWERMMEALETMDASVGADDFLAWLNKFITFENAIKHIHYGSPAQHLLNNQGVEEFFDAQEQIRNAVMQELDEALGITDLRISLENILVDSLSDGIVKQKLMKWLVAGSYLGAVASGIVAVSHGIWHLFLDSLAPISFMNNPFTSGCGKVGAAFVVIALVTILIGKNKQKHIDTIVDSAILQVIDEMRAQRDKAAAEAKIDTAGASQGQS